MCLNYRGANHGGFVEGAAVAPGGQPAAAADVNGVASCSLHLSKLSMYMFCLLMPIYVSIFGSIAAVYLSVLFIFILIHHLQSSQSVFWVHRLTFISPGNYKENYQNKDFRQNLFNALYINISLYPSIYLSIHLLFYKYTYYAFIYLYR